MFALMGFGYIAICIFALYVWSKRERDPYD
jgi:hypothetical protein